MDGLQVSNHGTAPESVSRTGSEERLGELRDTPQFVTLRVGGTVDLAMLAC